MANDRMIYLQHEPGPELRPWVRALWYARGMNFGHRRERILPTGRAQVILNLARNFTVSCAEGKPDTAMSSALLAGQRSRYEIIDTADLADLIGIVFEPGALPVFLADAADRVSNGFVDLGDVWRDGPALRDRLLEIPGSEARMRCLEDYLRGRPVMQRKRGRTDAHPAVQFALRELSRAASMARVADVARSTGWSERRFSQVFREEVGFSPKVWCRIQRFQRAVRQFNQNQAVAWSDLAIDCGFYDQAHLANEFRAFSGISPTTYVESPGRIWANHVRL
jgi:AraC-like DNA-binding protein